MQEFDAIVLGAGAAGLFCAARAGQRGLRVLLIDHAPRLAEKLRISGGGRANFTNRDLDPHAPHRHFLGANPAFCRSALARFTPQDFIDLMQRHRVPFHEKHKGQLFCDHSAQDVIDLLLAECEAARAAGGLVERWQPCRVVRVEQKRKGQKREDQKQEGQGSPEEAERVRYVVHTERETKRETQSETKRASVCAPSLVVATGGLSIPKIGASGLGFELARQFGLPVVPTCPALVPLTFDPAQWAPFANLAGLSLPVRVSTGSKKQRMVFDEDLLFTHRGLSGPAVLQISSYWQPGTPIEIDLLPDRDLAADLLEAKNHSRRWIANELATWLPARLADTWVQQNPAWAGPIAQASDKALRALADSLQRWQITPSGTQGYAKAEVTAGGVDTRALSSKTMQAKAHPGLYFIGEVVDITGWLGGYNFQWAWASAAACAESLTPRP